MKKSLLSVGAASLMLAVFATGCATSGTHGEVAEKYKEFQEAVAANPPVYVVTGERSLDNAAKLSAEVYTITTKFLSEYVKATENNRYYIGFVNDATELAKEKKIPMPQAMAEVLASYKEADSKVTDPSKKVFARVVEGYNAVQALKPENKIREIAPTVKRALRVAAQAKDLANVITKTYSKIDFRDVAGMAKKVKVTASLIEVTKQTYFNVRALEFLVDQYKRNLEMKNYMK